MPYTSILREAIDGLPAKARRAIYVGVALIGLILTVVQAVILSLGAGMPPWLIGGWAGYGVLSPLVGIVATSHLSGPTSDPADGSSA